MIAVQKDAGSTEVVVVDHLIAMAAQDSSISVKAFSATVLGTKQCLVVDLVLRWHTVSDDTEKPQKPRIIMAHRLGERVTDCKRPVHRLADVATLADPTIRQVVPANSRQLSMIAKQNQQLIFQRIPLPGDLLEAIEDKIKR